jgi:hypothetical protein
MVQDHHPSGQIALELGASPRFFGGDSAVRHFVRALVPVIADGQFQDARRARLILWVTPRVSRPTVTPTLADKPVFQRPIFIRLMKFIFTV